MRLEKMIFKLVLNFLLHIYFAMLQCSDVACDYV